MEPLWSPRGLQSVATGRKFNLCRSRGNKPKLLPPVATGCRRRRMVEGVDGSSPSEGSAKAPQSGASPLASSCAQALRSPPKGLRATHSEFVDRCDSDLARIGLLVAVGIAPRGVRECGDGHDSDPLARGGVEGSAILLDLRVNGRALPRLVEVEMARRRADEVPAVREDDPVVLRRGPVEVGSLGCLGVLADHRFRAGNYAGRGRLADEISLDPVDRRNERELPRARLPV